MKVGIPESKLAALASWETSDAFSERERVALAFAAAVVRDDRDVSDACWARLREHFTEPEIVELAFAIGFQTFATTFAKAFQLVPQGFSSESGPIRPRIPA